MMTTATTTTATTADNGCKFDVYGRCEIEETSYVLSRTQNPRN